MPVRLVGPFDTSAGLDQLVVPAGDKIGTLNVLQAPGPFNLFFGSMGPFPLVQGHLFTNLDPQAEGIAGVRVVVPAVPGTLILVAGVDGGD